LSRGRPRGRSRRRASDTDDPDYHLDEPARCVDDDGIEGTAGNETDNNGSVEGSTTSTEGVTDDDTPGFGVGGAAIAALLLVLSISAASRRPRD